ncbi:SDR family oxidoreductase [Streptomyces sp. NPDC055092]
MCVRGVIGGAGTKRVRPYRPSSTCPAPTNPSGTHVRCDVTDDDTVHAAIDTVVDQFGGLHVLVNGAGIGAQSTVEDTSSVLRATASRARRQRQRHRHGPRGVPACRRT